MRGGNRVIRYGMARELVLGIEVVLPDGTVVMRAKTKSIKDLRGLLQTPPGMSVSIADMRMDTD